MAYGIKNISPLDLRKSVSVGVKIPFSEKKVFTPVFTTKEQLRYNIINFLLTNRRERIFAPNFGADIRKRLFEQISQDTADELKMSIVTQVENYFPNVRVRELLVEGSPSTGTIRIRFSYSIVNTNEEDVLLVDIQNQ
jgi:phage baseplate assembly protein W